MVTHTFYQTGAACLLLIVVSCMTMMCSTDAEPVHPFHFVHSYEGRLAVGESHTPLVLMGVNFWAYDDEYPDEDLAWYDNMFNADSFLEVRNPLQMNVVRLNMDFRRFEEVTEPYSYLSSGWDGLDHIIDWADQAGVYLILDMHTPPGGYQSFGFNGAFWGTSELDLENQDRLKQLWKAIAQRYQHNPTIAAFDIINEPLPESTQQYFDYIQEVIHGIRSVDKNHVLIVEEAFNSDFTWQLLDDTNLCYDVHFYNPWNYCSQDDGSVIYPHSTLTKQTLREDLLEQGLQFALSNQIPLNIGEYGVKDYLIKNAETVGLEAYLTDLLALFDEYNLSSQLWSYQSSEWGFYEYTGNMPDESSKREFLYTFYANR